MRALFREQGASLRIGIIAEEPAQQFIQEHAAILDSSFAEVRMSDTLRQSLSRSNYIFSGIKTFHEMNEAFPSLIDENGNRKPFERFLNDVQKINQTYNRNYLRAEYNFAHASAQGAARWEQIEKDGDEFNLQYRTAQDGNVRPEHAALHGVTLPPSDPFWRTYYPPNGWNCRCTVVQVLRDKYPTTPRDEAIRRGEEATGKDTKGIFKFNPGIERKTFPDYNPYTIKRCNDCDIAKGNLKLARPFIPDYELCTACQLLRQCQEEREKAKENYEHWQKIRELQQSGRFPVIRGGGFKEYDNLESGKLAVSCNKRNLLFDHLHSDEQIRAAEYIWNHPEQLHSPHREYMEDYYREGGFAEGEMRRKIQKKIDERHVDYYNWYKFTFEGKEWTAHLEHTAGGSENIYNVILE